MLINHCMMKTKILEPTNLHDQKNHLSYYQSNFHKLYKTKNTKKSKSSYRKLYENLIFSIKWIQRIHRAMTIHHNNNNKFTTCHSIHGETVNNIRVKCHHQLRPLYHRNLLHYLLIGTVVLTIIRISLSNNDHKCSNHNYNLTCPQQMVLITVPS